MNDDRQHDGPRRVPIAERVTLPGFTPSREAVHQGGVTATPHTGSLPRIRDGLRPKRFAIRDLRERKDRRARGKAGHPKRRRARGSHGGWMPDQHGAWAMVIIPFWVGVYLSAFAPAHLLLFALWVVGYMAFFATSLWLRSRRKERYWPPVRTYGLITLILGAATVMLEPPLLEWALVFLPLVAIASWQAATRRERSLLSRTVTVLASGLMCLVTYDLGTGFARSTLVPSWLQHAQGTEVPVAATGGTLSGWAWAGCVTFWLIAYYWTAVPYVKTMVRQRGSRGYLALSWGAHAICLLLACVAAVKGWTTWALPVCWLVLTLRAVLFPVYAARSKQKRVPIRAVGLSEICFSILVLVTLLVRF